MRTLICVILSVFIFAGCTTGKSAREVALAAKKKYEQSTSSVSSYQQPQESLAQYYMNLIATALVQVGVLLFGLKLFKGLL